MNIFTVMENDRRFLQTPHDSIRHAYASMHKRGVCCHAVSVCVSAMFVSCVKTNKDIFENF